MSLLLKDRITSSVVFLGIRSQRSIQWKIYFSIGIKTITNPKNIYLSDLKKKEAKQPVCRRTVCSFVSALISAVEEWRRFSTWYSHDRFDIFFEFISIFYQNNLFLKCKYKTQQNNPRRMFWTQILLTAPNKHPRFRVKIEQISHFILLF